jgi:hypothetical protein
MASASFDCENSWPTIAVSRARLCLHPAPRRQITNLVDDEKGGTGEEPQTFAQCAFPFGLCKGGDDFGERGERNALSSLHGLDRERRREMAFACAWRPEQMDHLGAVDELQFCKRQDAIAIERGLEREVEAGKRFDGRLSSVDEYSPIVGIENSLVGIPA